MSYGIKMSLSSGQAHRTARCLRLALATTAANIVDTRVVTHYPAVIIVGQANVVPVAFLVSDLDNVILVKETNDAVILARAGADVQTVDGDLNFIPNFGDDPELGGLLNNNIIIVDRLVENIVAGVIQLTINIDVGAFIREFFDARPDWRLNDNVTTAESLVKHSGIIEERNTADKQAEIASRQSPVYRSKRNEWPAIVVRADIKSRMYPDCLVMHSHRSPVMWWWWRTDCRRSPSWSPVPGRWDGHRNGRTRHRDWCDHWPGNSNMPFVHSVWHRYRRPGARARAGNHSGTGNADWTVKASAGHGLGHGRWRGMLEFLAHFNLLTRWALLRLSARRKSSLRRKRLTRRQIFRHNRRCSSEHQPCRNGNGHRKMEK